MSTNFIEKAFQQALLAYQNDEVPVGALIVKDNKVIAEAHNLVETLKNPCAHAEILAIQKACEKLNVKRLPEYELYTTLEPCPMCSGAILHARIKRVTYLAKDFKWGCDGSILNYLQKNEFNHVCQTSYKPHNEYVKLLKSFFKSKRK